MRSILPLLLALTPGCTVLWVSADDVADKTGQVESDDRDGDGFPDDVDCAADDASVHPNADEVPYDGIDNDCEPLTLDDDLDEDGFDADVDCDDDNADVHPGATDDWYDGTDSDCDGASDYDADGDGFDSDAHGGADCDDTDADYNPDADDPFYDGEDTNCDGASDYDADGDGFDATEHSGTDCDDTDTTVNPDAPDTWYDGVDSNCDGADDYDADGDGYLFGDDDCADDDPAVNPGATEVPYDGIDNDCDVATPDDDIDGDSFINADDCDDDDPAVNPNADEVCNLVDDNCTGASELTGVSRAGVQYADIEAALAGAADGDTIYFCSHPVGTPVFALIAGLDLTIQGVGGRDVAVMDGEGVGANAVIDLRGATLTLADVTVRGGTESGILVANAGSLTATNVLLIANSAPDVGGGLYSTQPVTLHDVEVSGNTALRGGGVAVIGTDLIVDDGSIIENNDATAEGGGLYALNSELTLDATVQIRDNTAADGAGGYIGDSDLTGGTFTGNQASASGGGLYVTAAGGQTLANVVVSSNGAGSVGGGGIAFGPTSDTTLDALVISGNAATNGAGLYLSAENTVRALTATIEDNTGEKGAGAYLTGVDGDSPLLEVRDSSVQNNTGQACGVLHVDYGQLHIYDGTFGNNVASDLSPADCGPWNVFEFGGQPLIQCVATHCQ